MEDVAVEGTRQAIARFAQVMECFAQADAALPGAGAGPAACPQSQCCWELCVPLGDGTAVLGGMGQVAKVSRRMQTQVMPAPNV